MDAGASAAVRAATGSNRHPNGCPLRATLFASAPGTNCTALADLWRDGFEVAASTASGASVSPAAARVAGPACGGGFAPDYGTVMLLQDF